MTPPVIPPSSLARDAWVAFCALAARGYTEFVGAVVRLDHRDGSELVVPAAAVIELRNHARAARSNATNPITRAWHTGRADAFVQMLELAAKPPK